MRMERKWTPAQKSAIDTRDCNVLVSAAAGSGKTAVLVERIISMITDPDKNIDIDRLVVVTFTKAAAAQMKDKIRKALDSMLDENPGDVNLLRQITLLNNAQITTIDSFCLWIIRNHFPEVNLDPGFRIMDEGEKKLIENDVLEDVLEEFYAEADEEFFNLVDAFGMGRDDSGLVSIIDKIYRFSRSNPWIDEWFDECMLVYDDETYDNPAIKELYDSIKNALFDYRDKYNRLVDICSEPAGPAAYTGALQSDLLGINEMINSQDFGELGRRIRIFSFEALSRKKDAGADPDIKEYVKGQRKLFKDYIGRLNDKIFLKDDEGIFADMQGAGIQIRTLLKVAKVYAKRVSEVKREKGIIDFNDMEHLALSILVKKEDGKLVYTETADKLANRFEEILIDEYQDSNQLQEVILNAVSKTRLTGENNNIYMVGDVKQSIYKFRLACPELFIEKYDTYGETGDNVRIELQKNFRSRENVLECVNDVFSHIMNKNFSGIGYDESVRLNAGFPYPEYSDSNYGDEANKSTDVILISSENEEEATTRELEADRLAKLIEGIVASGINVYDSDENIYRPAEYRDIVILTRSVTGWADTFADALMDRGIPAYTDSSTGYFSVREIQVILSMLTIVDNPVQEISLAAAMMSYFGGFTAAELGMVLLVGGSTRVPAVVEEVRRITGKEPSHNLNPDECVALGAAVQGGKLGGAIVAGSSAAEIILMDVTPLSLGIETVGGVSTKIIDRNTTIPTRYSQIFTTAGSFQTSVDIKVLQGERQFARDNKLIGNFRLKGIKPAPAGVPQIEVTFDIDANGIVQVSAKDLGTGKHQEITITASSNLSDSEIEQAIREAQEYEATDGQRKAYIDARSEADTLVRQVENVMADKEKRKAMDSAQKKSVKSSLSYVKKLISRTKPGNVSEEQAAEIKHAADELRNAAAGLI